MTDSLFLKPNVVAEPLVNGWYAWPYLLPPVHAAMYVANHHLKLLQSFVANPQVHAAALKDPAMAGGPFLHHPPQRAGEMKNLLEHTLATQGPLLELAGQIRELDRLLSETDGTSLESLYPRVPEALRGFVELVYDLQHHASFRLLEPLLYRTPWAQVAEQSVRLFLAESDERSFVLSTPRVADEESLNLPVRFGDPALDLLFRRRVEPGPIEPLIEALRVPASQVERFRGLFAQGRPQRSPRPTGPGVRIRYFGHACLYFETARTTVLFDPIIPYRFEGASPRLSFDDLPDRIDYVVITHNHQDHVVFESLLPLRHRIGTVVVPRSVGGTLADPSLKRILHAAGFPTVLELESLDELPLPGGKITALPFLGEHADLDIQTKSTYLVQLEGRTAVVAADSNNIEPRLCERLRAGLGQVDALFVGMECEGGPMSWLYGPLFTRPLSRKVDHSRRFDGSDCRKALAQVQCLNPRRAFVYAMGQEPWMTFLTSLRYTETSKPIVESNRLVESCRALGMESERLFGARDIPL